MVVQHNLQAMNANRMLGITTNGQSKSTEKLSSGFKINRAADDAAGLTISEKMRKQIRGLDRASTNAQDGISCVQTAEGALTEVHAMLQRMNELAVQSANGTNSETDRKAVQDEIDQLVTEIDRVSETTKFNETYLLKGDNVEKSTVTVPGAVEVAYKDTISADKKLEFKTGGTNIWATKDGVSTAVSATNFSDFFEVGKTTGTKNQDAADAATAGAGNDYQITDATSAVAGGTLSATGTLKNTAVKVDTVFTYDGANSVWTNDQDATTISTADLQTLTGLTISNANNGNTLTITAATVAAGHGDLYAEGGTEVLDDFGIITEAENGNTLYKVAAETIETEGVKVKDGYEIYTVADATTSFGNQLPNVKASDSDIASNFNLVSDLLLDKDGNSVSPDQIADYFDDQGVYQGGLYKNDAANNPPLTEIGAEQIDDYVDWTRGEPTTKEVVTNRDALVLNLHVGADSDDTNKIAVNIVSMDATTLGLRDDDGNAISLSTEDDATKAIDTIAAAIAKVSEQRSALGAIQNRLEHTISNLDNVVENTTAAESRIRDTDMAEEMVEYSKNNILAQAGQSMLAQANQSTQGVLSLLG